MGHAGGNSRGRGGVRARVSEPIKVEIWSDVACPWCYIGKRKFEAGRAAYAAAGEVPAVEVEYRSYELSPDTPVDFEGSVAEFLAQHKGIPVERAEQMQQHVTGIAAQVGLDYRMDQVQHTKTLKAHQLLHLAKQHGRQLELAELLFAAYFEQGKHIGHDEQLAELAAEAGLDRAEALAALADERYLPDVLEDIAQAGRYGIQGVPFFVIDGRYGISGAQAPEAFEQALRQVAAERTEAATADVRS